MSDKEKLELAIKTLEWIASPDSYQAFTIDLINKAKKTLGEIK